MHKPHIKHSRQWKIHCKPTNLKIVFEAQTANKLKPLSRSLIGSLIMAGNTGDSNTFLKF